MPDNGRDTPSRLDRIEAIIEVLASTQADLEAEHPRILRAQVIMVDTVQKLADAHQKLADAHRQTEESLNGLIAVVDGLVRRNPPASAPLP